MTPEPGVGEEKLYQSMSKQNSVRFSYKKEGYGKISEKFPGYTNRTRKHEGETAGWIVIVTKIQQKDVFHLRSHEVQTSTIHKVLKGSGFIFLVIRNIV